AGVGGGRSGERHRRAGADDLRDRVGADHRQGVDRQRGRRGVGRAAGGGAHSAVLLAVGGGCGGEAEGGGGGARNVVEAGAAVDLPLHGVVACVGGGRGGERRRAADANGLRERVGGDDRQGVDGQRRAGGGDVAAADVAE